MSLLLPTAVAVGCHLQVSESVVGDCFMRPNKGVQLLQQYVHKYHIRP